MDRLLVEKYKDTCGQVRKCEEIPEDSVVDALA
jgi:hypothetical protein